MALTLSLRNKGQTQPAEKKSPEKGVISSRKSLIDLRNPVAVLALLLVFLVLTAMRHPRIEHMLFREPAAHLAAFYLNTEIESTPQGPLLHSNPPILVEQSCSGWTFFCLAALLPLFLKLSLKAPLNPLAGLPRAYLGALAANSMRLIATPLVKQLSNALIPVQFHDATHLFAGILIYLFMITLMSILYLWRPAHANRKTPITA